MKNIFYLLFCTIFILAACAEDIMGTDSDPDNFENIDPDSEPDYNVNTFVIKLDYPSGFESISGVDIRINNNLTGSSYKAKTDEQGIVRFKVETGLYDVFASETRPASEEGFVDVFNGSTTGITVNKDRTVSEVSEVKLTRSKSGQLIIKEFYVGGCQKDDGSGAFYQDKYVILYNNSGLETSLENVCLGMVLPYLANNNLDDRFYAFEPDPWVPAGTGFWYFQNELRLQPGEQVVVALANAVDLTQTYKQSINFANSDYYCCYDIESYPNLTYYPAPSELIPTSHYLKAFHYGTGNAWPLTHISPAFFVFQTKGTTPATFAADATNIDIYNNVASQVRKKVPASWVLDGIDVWSTAYTTQYKRLPDDIDAGVIYLTNQYGHTLYRNVDQDATEALEENQGKIIYNYTHGEDPSGIDAEASLKNGARIIYKDTNNSTNDFHERSQASLRD